MEELKVWIKENGLDCLIEGNLISIKDFGNFYFINHKEGKILSEEFLLILNEEDEDFIEENKDNINFVVFKFGEDFYYSKMNFTKNQYNELAIKPEFNDFLNIGNYVGELDSDFNFVNLAIHTGYELLNGSGEPEDYIKKAKFFRQKYLGVCELDTLASSLAFQLSCKKYHINPIIGEGISVAYNYNFDNQNEIPETFELKLYVKNKKGWKTLLNISKHVNVDFNKFIPFEILSKYKTKDLICVIPTDSWFNFNIFNKDKALIELNNLNKIFGKKNIYYQLDLSEYQNSEYDLEKLEIIKRYFSDFSDLIKPVYIQDTYVVDRKDRELKSFLNKISRKVSITNNDCYLKSVDEIITSTSKLFDSNDDAFNIFLESIENTEVIAKQCVDFEISIGKPKLPDFKMPKNTDKIDFYYDLIEKGIEKKIMTKKGITDEKIDEYIKRIETENEIIIGADIVDYFLILWDIVEWCKKENILVGVGRGSAGGSLIAYLLDITNIDPIEYNLLFERFLNKTRTMPEVFYKIELEDGTKYQIPEDFYNKKIKGLKDLNPKMIKDFMI